MIVKTGFQNTDPRYCTHRDRTAPYVNHSTATVERAMSHTEAGRGHMCDSCASEQMTSTSRGCRIIVASRPLVPDLRALSELGTFGPPKGQDV
jgi:hypothetical protein